MQAKCRIACDVTFICAQYACLLCTSIKSLLDGLLQDQDTSESVQEDLRTTGSDSRSEICGSVQRVAAVRFTSAVRHCRCCSHKKQQAARRVRPASSHPGRERRCAINRVRYHGRGAVLAVLCTKRAYMSGRTRIYRSLHSPCMQHVPWMPGGSRCCIT